MRFKIDENLPSDTAQILIAAGHDASTVLEQSLHGHPDLDVITACSKEGRALLLLDMDFADIRTYPPEQLPGLIVLRPRMQDKIMVLDLIRRLLPSFTREPLVGHLWIADESSLRIRPEP